jgi:hypothetical protein
MTEFKVFTFIIVPLVLMLYIKAYYHAKFRGIIGGRNIKISFFDLLINPIVWLKIIYLFLPIFFSPSDTAKQNPEIETKIRNSIKVFWAYCGIIIIAKLWIYISVNT